ncbi:MULTISPECIES: hypothetical protein [unclassified Hymenobacter]|nr:MULTISPECIES: hypothetical protein [unclassified Hymenobacter]
MPQLASLLLSCATLTTASCSKENAAPSGPKEYQLEDRVTSTTAPESDYLSYDNESGGTTALNHVPLPATYHFKYPRKPGDQLSLLASLDGGEAAAEITASILLDGRAVKKETSRSANAPAVPVYVIGQ